MFLCRSRLRNDHYACIGEHSNDLVMLYGHLHSFLGYGSLSTRKNAFFEVARPNYLPGEMVMEVLFGSDWLCPMKH